MPGPSRPTRKSAAKAQEVIKQDLARREKLTAEQRAAEDEDEEDEELVLDESQSASYDDSEDLGDETSDEDE